MNIQDKVKEFKTLIPISIYDVYKFLNDTKLVYTESFRSDEMTTNFIGVETIDNDKKYYLLWMKYSWDDDSDLEKQLFEMNDDEIFEAIEEDLRKKVDNAMQFNSLEEMKKYIAKKKEQIRKEDFIASMY